MKEMVNGFTMKDMPEQNGNKICGCNGCTMHDTGMQQPMTQPMQQGMQQPMQQGMQQPMTQPMQQGMQQPMAQPMQQGMYEGMIDCNTCVQESVGFAEAYVPFQTQLNLKDAQTALACGTAFSQLVQPYIKNLRK